MVRQGNSVAIYRAKKWRKQFATNDFVGWGKLTTAALQIAERTRLGSALPQKHIDHSLPDHKVAWETCEAGFLQCRRWRYRFRGEGVLYCQRFTDKPED